MRRRQAPAGGRAVRVAEQIHHELAELIRAEVKDPRIGMVTVNQIDLTPDYAYATVWYSVIPDDAASIDQTQQGLAAAAGFLRSQIGRRVRIHTTPELRFRHDPSIQRGIAMSRLIDDAVARRVGDDDEAGRTGDDDEAPQGEAREGTGPAA